MFTGIYRLSINQFNIVWGGGGRVRERVPGGGGGKGAMTWH